MEKQKGGNISNILYLCQFDLSGTLMSKITLHAYV